MEFELQDSPVFRRQLDGLSDKAKRQLETKLILAKKNPFRNKRIHGFPLVLFRIRLEDNGLALRIIYTIDVKIQAIKLICILDRRKDYKDLENNLRNM